MNALAKHNARLKAFFLKAGFILEQVKDSPLAFLIVAEHRHLCGIHLRDSARSIQLGVGDSPAEAAANARPCGRSALPALWAQLSKLGEAGGNRCVWVCGPNANWIAKGYGFHLSELCRLAEEDAKVIQAARDHVAQQNGAQS